RRLKEVTLDFGNQFTSFYRRKIEQLSAEILDSLEKDDERRLDRAQADLQDVLYELNREVRLQYEDEEDEGFFSSLRRTFTGDKEEDFPYPPRRPSYQDDYRSSYERDDYRSGYERNDSRSDYDRGGSRSGYERNDSRSDYDRGGSRSGYERNDSRSNTDQAYETRNSRPQYRNSPSDESSRSYNRSRSRNVPYQNDWDEEDDDWF
ncbi:MAG: molecular chaperone DnaK, partial [Microcystaceae cyanobacterium]